MKVTHIVTRLGRGGTDDNVLHLAGWQRRNGHQASLVVGESSDTTRAPSWLPVEVVGGLVREPAPAADLRALRAVRRILVRERPDVVHTHQSKAGIVGRLAAVRRVPVTVHTVHMASFGPSYGRTSRVFEGTERVCARFTDVFVSVGDELRDTYLDRGMGRPERFVVVRSPVRLESFLAVRDWGDERRRAGREGLGLPAGAAVLLSVGFLERRKRHDLLLRRLRPLLGSGRAVLVVAGTGERLPELEGLARELGVDSSVRFLGHVDGVEEVFGVADVLVHTSAVEGVPQVVVQALAAGLPVVATETEGLREVPGSPVRIVDRSGSELLSAVEAAISRPDAPVARERLEQWTEASIEGQIGELHGLLETCLAGRTG